MGQWTMDKEIARDCVVETAVFETPIRRRVNNESIKSQVIKYITLFWSYNNIK